MGMSVPPPKIMKREEQYNHFGYFWWELISRLKRQWQFSAGIGGSFQPEWVAGFAGISGSFGPEYTIVMLNRNRFKNQPTVVLNPSGEYLRVITPDVEDYINHFKVIHDGKLLFSTSIGLKYSPMVYDQSVMQICGSDGQFIKAFGGIVPFGDRTMCKTGNAVWLAIDEHGDIYVTYVFQNRIEKYNQVGEIMMRIKRKLRYRQSLKAKVSLIKNKDGEVRGAGLPIMNFVSCGIGIDSEGRLWIMTLSRQPKYSRFGEIADGERDYTKLEVYNRQGYLIEEIPLKCNIDPRVNCLFIKGRRLFVINNNDVSVTEYKILN